MATIEQLTIRQCELLRLMNPLEYGFSQYESSVLMGLSERQVRRIYRQLKFQFPEAMERFDKLKRDTNRLGRRLKNPWVVAPSSFGQDTLQNLKIVRIWQ